MTLAAYGRHVRFNWGWSRSGRPADMTFYHGWYDKMPTSTWPECHYSSKETQVHRA